MVSSSSVGSPLLGVNLEEADLLILRYTMAATTTIISTIRTAAVGTIVANKMVWRSAAGVEGLVGVEGLAVGSVRNKLM